ncbi:MAG: helix-turn-helix domain-containing protein [Actinobacteria bacterium]|nr:helix-turn-helix domain-containing protein [Actinomycetota bacterium]
MDRQGREQFGTELRRLRERAGLSLGELAKLAHVHRGYVGHIEHGERWPSRQIVEALDPALGVGGRSWMSGGLRCPPAQPPWCAGQPNRSTPMSWRPSSWPAEWPPRTSAARH